MHYLTLAWATFCAAAPHVATVLLIVNWLARRIPAERFAELERTAPRVANGLRFFRAIGPDGDKAVRALAAAATGRAWLPLLSASEPAPVGAPPTNASER
jgi:hypothetical protein